MPTIAYLVAAFDAARAQHATLRAEAEHVPGGAVDVPASDGYVDRQRRLGFTG